MPNAHHAQAEKRYCPHPIRLERRQAAADQPAATTVAGYAALYYDGTPATEFRLWDDTVERILPGAFDRAAREDDCRGLFNHNADLVLGRTAAGTCRLTVDAKGLAYEIDLPDTQAARDLAVALQRGDVSGSSFTFEATDQAWAEVDGLFIREIRAVTLWDVGPVTFPAYTATTAGIRAHGAAAEEAARASLHAWKASRAAARSRAVGVRLRLAEILAKHR